MCVSDVLVWYVCGVRGGKGVCAGGCMCVWLWVFEMKGAVLIILKFAYLCAFGACVDL